jgi:hypothetical protein
VSRRAATKARNISRKRKAKSEIRISKSETNSKFEIQNSRSETNLFGTLGFCHLILFRVSDPSTRSGQVFVLRIYRFFIWRHRFPRTLFALRIELLDLVRRQSPSCGSSCYFDSFLGNVSEMLYFHNILVLCPYALSSLQR